MVLLRPLKADVLNQHVEEEKKWGQVGGYILQGAKGKVI